MDRLTIILLTLITIFTLSVSTAHAETTYLGQIIEIDADNAEQEIKDLEENGIIVLRHRDELALCLVPENDNGNTEKNRLKVRKSRLKPSVDKNYNIPTLINAHRWYDAKDIHTGISGSAYDGTGVVVGFCDIGFDASHIAFQRPDGTSRIVRSVQYKESEGKRIVCDTPEEIAEWLTDSDRHTHATHVAGILAGSYDVDGLGGAAPGADIVATTSQLTDVGILAGVEDIIEYARTAGKPAVVNLSVGNYLGPHDGTSLFARYLDKCGSDAIICISSGNEGAGKNTFSVTFSDDRPQMIFKITSRVGLNLELYGATDFWMADNSHATIAPMIIDTVSGDNIVYEFEQIDFDKTPVVVLRSSDTDATRQDDGIHIIESSHLGHYFTGMIVMYGETDKTNCRYHIYMEYDLQTEIKTDGKPWGRYLLGGKAIASPGSHMDIYADGVYSAFSRFGRSDLQPGSVNSVSDLATGHNVICVGQYNNCKEIKYCNGDSWVIEGEAGEITPYSGYGTLLDGRILPHTSAPGFPLVSAYSSPFLANPENEWHRGRVVTASRGDYKPTDIRISPEQALDYHPEYYYWGPDGGTSMSAPYVAGYIATWLQANPDLNIADIKGIIDKTNDRTDHRAYNINPRNGQGFFNPVSGLREAMFLSTAADIVSNPETVVRVIDKTLHVAVPRLPAQGLPLSVIDINGRTILSTHISDQYTVIDLSHLSTGIYIAAIPGYPANKIAIK
ncbi:MAG: S8 family peptidase [Muribaculaceae bacterium]|nr:S8 family peptidase [Muribaculaceae bacterium]